MNVCIIQTTCSSKIEAKNIASILVKEKLAACVQMHEVKSIYIWDDNLCDDNEIILNIKTKKEHFQRVKSKIKELHSYDVPEIIQLDITNLSKKYLRFIEKNTL